MRVNMKSFRIVLGSCLLSVLLAACGGSQSLGGGAGGVAMMPGLPGDRHMAYMAPDAKEKSALMYAADWATNDVFVYDYPSGKQVGMLTGFVAPYGMCVDKKGDIYISNFYNGTEVEYAHGGTSPLKTYASVGEPMGCSVDAKGDLAVTSFNPGEVIVFARGDPTKGTTYTGPCEFLWTMGYDPKGNLIGLGEEGHGAIVACALLAGSESMITLSGCCTGPIQIDFPGSTMWDGKYIALGDQEVTGKIEASAIAASLSGTTLSEHGTTILADDCGSYTPAANPFIVGAKNTPANRRRGRVVAGVLPCSGSSGGIGLWHYPRGGAPFKSYTGLSDPHGVVVSLKT